MEIKEKHQSFSTTRGTKCASMNCKVIQWGTENKNLGKKRDVLHLEGVEDESGPGHCLTIQLTCASDTGYVSLRCTKQHIFIKGWEVPLIQEWQKSDLGNTTHSSSSICTRKRYRNCYFTHWKSLEKASIRRKRKWRHFFSWEWSLFNPLKQSGRGQEYFL